MVMDDASNSAGDRRFLSSVLLFCTLTVAGCTTWVGTTAKSFLGHVRKDPDPNVRYVAYSKLGDPHAYDSQEEKDEAVRVLIEKYEKGHEPIATRAIICRTLGQLGDPRARHLLIRGVSSSEAVIKIESCRALGKVGRPEDATVLAQVMTLDNMEDARIAAIEGLAEIKTKDPRIYQMLVENMDHEDPAIRLASLNTLRKLTGKDHGTNPADWKRALKPLIDPGAPAAPPPPVKIAKGARLAPTTAPTGPLAPAPAPTGRVTPVAAPTGPLAPAATPAAATTPSLAPAPALEPAPRAQPRREPLDRIWYDCEPGPSAHCPSKQELLDPAQCPVG